MIIQKLMKKYPIPTISCTTMTCPPFRRPASYPLYIKLSSSNISRRTPNFCKHLYERRKAVFIALLPDHAVCKLRFPCEKQTVQVRPLTAKYNVSNHRILVLITRLKAGVSEILFYISRKKTTYLQIRSTRKVNQ